MLLELPDEELVRRCKQELPSVTRSYEVLVQRHTNRVYSLAYRLLGNRQEAEDVTQEVFVKVYHNLKKFEEQSTFSSWLYRITTNTALNALDKLKRSPQPVSLWSGGSGTTSGGSGDSGGGNLVYNETTAAAAAQVMEAELTYPGGSDTSYLDPLERIIHSELRNCIGEVLGQLEREQASVLLMRDLDDLSYEEVAQAVGVGLSAIKMRIYRARLAFQELFNRLCNPSAKATPVASSSKRSGSKRKAKATVALKANQGRSEAVPKPNSGELL